MKDTDSLPPHYYFPVYLSLSLLSRIVLAAVQRQKRITPLHLLMLLCLFVCWFSLLLKSLASYSTRLPRRQRRHHHLVISVAVAGARS